MRFVIVHNHFRPGGVRRVIEQAAPHLAKALLAREVVLLTGEAPDETWLADFRRSLGSTPVSCRADKAFGYLAEQHSKPALIAKRVRGVLKEILAQPDCLVWAHNPGLGRNLLLTRELNRICAQRGVPLVFHHHDWWFDNRWQRLREIRSAGFRTVSQIARTIFASDQSTRSAAINQSDAKILKRHSPRQAAWLANPVSTAPSPHPSPSRVRHARAWLDRQISERAPVWLMPCRLLRRKNIAEALLLTRWLRPEAWLVTTGGVSSSDEQAYADQLSSAAKKNGWRLKLGVLEENEKAKPSVPELLAASEVVLLTSCQEGFGLPYLEAATDRRPLICRTLLNIAPDLALFGLRFPQSYGEILVDQRLFNWAAERVRQKQLLSAFRRQMPWVYRKLVGVPPFLQGKMSPVPFSRLTLSAQLEILAQPVELSWASCAPLNPFLSKWRKLAQTGTLRVSQFPEKASRFLSGPAYAQRFLQMLRKRPNAAINPNASVAAQDDFIRQKLQSENLYPLTWPSRT